MKKFTFAQIKVGCMIAKIFGEVLRELRTAHNLSQEKLAEHSDLDNTYISLLERGLRQPTLTTIIKLAKALHIKPSQLIEKIEVQINQ
jgi:transcriptional regulator with XRE-family HTH domain